ncbi:MAG: phosphorybosylanthranilate isomerase, partial [Candidatus Eisenbacteria bacterium]|nr:phosphorybosylanthranilate isomerase [Candidatus Eisenbacteria bacterium]
RTGIPASAEDLDDLLEMGLDRDIYVGSGVKAENLGQFTKAAGVIIGSAIRRGGVAGAPLDIKRIRQFVSAWKSIDKG